jgi:hypothetical protein
VAVTNLVGEFETAGPVDEIGGAICDAVERLREETVEEERIVDAKGLLDELAVKKVILEELVEGKRLVDEELLLA